MKEKNGNKVNIKSNEFLLLFILIALIIILSISSKKFFTIDNIINIIRQMSFNGLISIGMAFVIIGAGIDLSVGSIAALTGIVFGALSCEIGIPWGSSFFIALLAGTLVGSINGTIIALLKIPSFIVTLGMQSVIRGICMISTNGAPISPLNEHFIFLGTGYIIGIPVPTIVFTLLFLMALICLNKTKFGRYIYACGNNVEAARVSGINVKKISFYTFAISGFTAAVSGLIMTARLTSAVPNMGAGSEMDAIAAVCVGGISLYGGTGSIVGMLIGVALMSIIRNGLNLLNVSTWWQLVIVGAILITAVFFSTRSSLSRR